MGPRGRIRRSGAGCRGGADARGRSGRSRSGCSRGSEPLLVGRRQAKLPPPVDKAGAVAAGRAAVAVEGVRYDAVGAASGAG